MADGGFLSADIGESFARTKELCELMSKDIRIQIKIMNILMRPCRRENLIVITVAVSSENPNILVYYGDSDVAKAAGSVLFIAMRLFNERRRCQKIMVVLFGACARQTQSKSKGVSGGHVMMTCRIRPKRRFSRTADANM